MQDKKLEESHKRKIQAGIARGWFLDEPRVYCPHCGERQQDAERSMPEDEYDWVEYHCEECRKIFRMQFVRVFSTEVIILRAEVPSV